MRAGWVGSLTHPSDFVLPHPAEALLRLTEPVTYWRPVHQQSNKDRQCGAI